MILMSVMIVIEKEKHLKWLDFKNQKYFKLDFCNVTALITVLAVTFTKTNQVFFAAVNSFSINHYHYHDHDYPYYYQ